MGWSVYVAVERASGLTPAERSAIVAHVARWNQEPWEVEPYDLQVPTRALRIGVLAHGAIKLPHDPDHPDVARLLEALSELRGLVPDARTAVADDLALIAWAEEEGSYVLAPAAQQPEVRTPRRSRSWVSARGLAAAQPAAAGAPAPAVDSGPLAAALAELRLPAALRDVQELGAAAVAARYPLLEPPVLELTAAERSALEDRERAHLARFGF